MLRASSDSVSPARMSPGWLTVLEGNNGTGQTQWARAGPRSPAALARGPCVGGLGESMPGHFAGVSSSSWQKRWRGPTACLRGSAGGPAAGVEFITDVPHPYTVFQSVVRKTEWSPATPDEPSPDRERFTEAWHSHARTGIFVNPRTLALIIIGSPT